MTEVNTLSDPMSWWDHLIRCRGTKADGTRCWHYRGVPYEIRPGDLYLPMTCWQHRDQEAELQRLAQELRRTREQAP